MSDAIASQMQLWQDLRQLLTDGGNATPDQLYQLHSIIHDWTERRGPLADRKYVAQLIERMAQLFQCDVPEHEGLELYFTTLCDYPQSLLEQAAAVVAKKHKWPRLPFPADFVTVIEKEADQAHWLLQNISTTHQILQRRSELL